PAAGASRAYSRGRASGTRVDAVEAGGANAAEHRAGAAGRAGAAADRGGASESGERRGAGESRVRAVHVGVDGAAEGSLNRARRALELSVLGGGGVRVAGRPRGARAFVDRVRRDNHGLAGAADRGRDGDARSGVPGTRGTGGAAAFGEGLRRREADAVASGGAGLPDPAGREAVRAGVRDRRRGAVAAAARGVAG